MKIKMKLREKFLLYLSYLKKFIIKTVNIIPSLRILPLRVLRRETINQENLNFFNKPIIKKLLPFLISALILLFFNLKLLKLFWFLFFAVYIFILIIDIFIVFKFQDITTTKESFIPNYTPFFLKKLIINHLIDLEEAGRLSPEAMNLWLYFRVFRILTAYMFLIWGTICFIFIPLILNLNF